MPEAAAATAEPEVAQPEVVDAPAEKKHADRRKKPKRQPPYNVLLWNDDDHSYAYVMTMLQELFGHPLEKGFQLAEQVDKQGRAIVLTTTREHAELKRDQIHAYGKDALIAACKGSMKASIEPTE
ncbi:MAG TPA: ATP-dependent Clp protease adaptor ClpS [Pirellulales bacterium]|nr:ATP-dependent Clp protease adaptor ClpS [Pirellulales bacterium]